MRARAAVRAVRGTGAAARLGLRRRHGANSLPGCCALRSSLTPRRYSGRGDGRDVSNRRRLALPSGRAHAAHRRRRSSTPPTPSARRSARWRRGSGDSRRGSARDDVGWRCGSTSWRQSARWWIRHRPRSELAQSFSHAERAGCHPITRPRADAKPQTTESSASSSVFCVGNVCSIAAGSPGSPSPSRASSRRSSTKSPGSGSGARHRTDDLRVFDDGGGVHRRAGARIRRGHAAVTPGGAAPACWLAWMLIAGAVASMTAAWYAAARLPFVVAAQVGDPAAAFSKHRRRAGACCGTPAAALRRWRWERRFRWRSRWRADG